VGGSQHAPGHELERLLVAVHILLGLKGQWHLVEEHPAVDTALQGARKTDLVGQALEEHRPLELAATADHAQGNKVRMEDMAQVLQMTADRILAALLRRIEVQRLEILVHHCKDGLGDQLAPLGHVIKIDGTTDPFRILHQSMDLK